jgi:arylesterase / paraoxonase
MRKNPWRRIAVTVSAMLVVLLLAASFRYVQSRGFFASVEDKTPAACHAVAKIAGVSAIAPDLRDDVVYIATRHGEVYAYLNGVLVKFSGVPKDFHPLALSVNHPAHDTSRLFAVFARGDGSYAMATFEVGAGKLIETGRLTTDQLTDPADLVTSDPLRFYLVNRHGSHTAFGRWLDDAFLIPRGEVLFFDGMKFIPVANRLNSPSGVAASPDGGHLVVAEELPRTLASFSRNVFSGALDNAELIRLPAAPTKISVARDGSLIVAAWPKRGTGAVYRVRVADGVPQPAELLYSTKSEEITAAAEVNGHLLIGSEKRLLDCKL